MKVMIRFMRTMLLLPKPWVAWLGLLMFVNMIAPLIFLPTLESIVVLIVFVIAALIQMSIFASKGFVRLLGLGHFVWILLIPWLFLRLDYAPYGSTFRIWLLTLMTLNSISLIIDVVDVIRYIMGERKPQLTLND